MKKRIVSALLRIYPASWRKEYGAEFRHLLGALEPRVRTVADVVWHGAWQRLRATEPWVLFGLPFMVAATIFYSVMIIAPPPYSPANDPRNVPVLALLLVNLSLTVGCGLWTVLRNGGTLPHAGLQTMKMALLIDVPHFIVYALLLAGALGVIVVGPGDTPTTIAEHGFAITFYSAGGTAPHAGLLLADRLVSTLICWLFGAIGGAFGRLIRTKLRPAH